MSEEWEEEEGVEENLEACNTTCSGSGKLTCVTDCVFEKWVESGIERWFGGREVKRVSEFTARSRADARKKVSKFSKEREVYTTLDFKDCRLLFDDEGRIVASTCSEELERDDYFKAEVPLRDRNVFVGIPKERIEGYTGSVESSPLTLGVAMLNYRFVKPEVVETTCLEDYDPKGLTIEDYGDQPVINLSWTNTLRNKVVLGGMEEIEYVREVMHTKLHELAHYLDALNMIEYEGGWWGETPIETWAVAVTGKPMPAGRELTSEKFANLLVRLHERLCPRLVEKEVKELREDIKYSFFEDTLSLIEDVKKVIVRFGEWLEKKYGDIFGWEIVPLDDGYMGVKYYIYEWSDEFKKFLKEELKEEYEKFKEAEKEAEETDLWQRYHDAKERLNVKAIEKLYEKFSRELKEKKDELAESTDLLVPTEEVTSSMFVSISFPALRIDIDELIWKCEPADADVLMPPEW